MADEGRNWRLPERCLLSCPITRTWGQLSCPSATAAAVATSQQQQSEVATMDAAEVPTLASPLDSHFLQSFKTMLLIFPMSFKSNIKDVWSSMRGWTYFFYLKQFILPICTSASMFLGYDTYISNHVPNKTSSQKSKPWVFFYLHPWAAYGTQNHRLLVKSIHLEWLKSSAEANRPYLY